MAEKDIIYADLDLEEGGKSLIQFKRFGSSQMIIPEDMEEETDDEAASAQKWDQKNIVDAEGNNSAAQNYHGVLQIMVPNEHRRFYEKVWLAKIFLKLSSCPGFR